jgi:hypothetical protein
METSGNLFKKQLDKAFNDPSIKLNSTTMGDAMKYKQSFKEEKIEGGVADDMTLYDIAKKHDKKGYYDIEDFVSSLKKQLQKGIKVELEHTNDDKVAKEIAMDHLFEDPNYYDKLKKIETKEQKEVSEKWSEKYKKSIDCSNPKGFSQKAHCDGRKKKDIEEERGYSKYFPGGKTDGLTSDTLNTILTKIAKSGLEDKKDNKGISKKKEPKEATGSGSSGAYVGPVFGGNDEFWRKSKSETPSLKEGDVEKVEATEATTSGSVGGYETPAMWAKSTKKKDWGPSRKTQIPGGGFVKIKKKCNKFPYCNQGDINNLKITKNESVRNAIKNVSSKLGISESTIITILEHEYEKVGKSSK